MLILGWKHRYLQQLVSAQATRNRELEQQLQSYRGGSSKDSSSPSTSAPVAGEEDTLMLHEEVGDFSLSLNGHSARRPGSSRKRFSGFELESVAEMDQDQDQDTDSHDHDMDRPSTAGTGTGGSPLSGSDDPDHDQDHEELLNEDEELQARGRKGRDGRPMGMGLVALKVEEGDGMETC